MLTSLHHNVAKVIIYTNVQPCSLARPLSPPLLTSTAATSLLPSSLSVTFINQSFILSISPLSLLSGVYFVCLYFLCFAPLSVCPLSAPPSLSHYFSSQLLSFSVPVTDSRTHALTFTRRTDPVIAPTTVVDQLNEDNLATIDTAVLTGTRRAAGKLSAQPLNGCLQDIGCGGGHARQ